MSKLHNSSPFAAAIGGCSPQRHRDETQRAETAQTLRQSDPEHTCAECYHCQLPSGVCVDGAAPPGAPMGWPMYSAACREVNACEGWVLR